MGSQCLSLAKLAWWSARHLSCAPKSRSVSQLPKPPEDRQLLLPSRRRHQRQGQRPQTLPCTSAPAPQLPSGEPKPSASSRLPLGNVPPSSGWCRGHCTASSTLPPLPGAPAWHHSQKITAHLPAPEWAPQIVASPQPAQCPEGATRAALAWTCPCRLSNPWLLWMTPSGSPQDQAFPMWPAPNELFPPILKE